MIEDEKDGIFINGGVGVAINFITEYNLLAFMHMDAIQILIAIACIFWSYYSNSSYHWNIDECLAILDSLCQSNTK